MMTLYMFMLITIRTYGSGVLEVDLTAGTVTRVLGITPTGEADTLPFGV